MTPASPSSGELDLAFISSALGPRVAEIAGEISAALRHRCRPVPAGLWRDLSEELWTEVELWHDRDFLRFQNALHREHPEVFRRRPRHKYRPRNLSRLRASAMPVPVSDSYCAQGAIGKRRLISGCYSFYETWSLAIEDIVQNGLRERVLGELSSGVTVRALLERMYGVISEDAPSPGVTHADEARWFRRALGRVRA